MLQRPRIHLMSLKSLTLLVLLLTPLLGGCGIFATQEVQLEKPARPDKKITSQNQGPSLANFPTPKIPQELVARARASQKSYKNVAKRYNIQLR